MKRKQALGSAALSALLLMLAACQNEAVPLPTVPPTTTPTAVPAPSLTPVPTSAATPTPLPTIGDATAAPTPTSPPTATPRPAPTPSGPTVAQVPPTNGAVRVEPMDSRDHFSTTMRIGEVVPGGYSTIPPTSGQHWGAWSDCGFYNHPLPDELLVHNLEHGNIIVSYNLPDDADVAALRAAVAAIPLAAEYAIVRRYHEIPEGMVAITTWGVLDRMMGVDPERIARFFADYPGNTGPEFANGLPCTTGIDMTQSSGG